MKAHYYLLSQVELPLLNHSHKQRKGSLETRAVGWPERLCINLSKENY